MLTFALDSGNARVFIDDTKSRCDYFCPVCGAPLIVRKGEVRRHHFAHKRDCSCTDSWDGTYDMSEWHFGWQEKFPEQNREICLSLGSVRHRADILVSKTVIEFQKSQLSKDQFDNRNVFYHGLGCKVVWLFDLRDVFEDGAMSYEAHGRNLLFDWKNPKKAFNAYDVGEGNVDLFLQIGDGDDECIVRVLQQSESGFEEFLSTGLMSKKDFLEWVGFREGVCPAPDIAGEELSARFEGFCREYRLTLNPEQQRAMQSVDGANLLLAVPGSGKTTVLVARLGYMTMAKGINPREIIAVTYTKAAAADMRKRFRAVFGDAAPADEIEFCTINSLANRIYEKHCRVRGLRSREVIGDAERKKLLRRIYKKANDDWATEGDILELESAISYIKNMMQGGPEIDEHAGPLANLRQMYEDYESELGAKGLMDFDDQLVFAYRAIREDVELRKWLHGKYRYWCVDEAQDTSRIQHALVYLIAGRTGNVFMVGDENQSIYGFRGAYPEAMLRFKEAYSNPFVMKLSCNYRSGSEIVEVANRFIGELKGRFEKPMYANRGACSRVEVVSVESREAQYPKAMELIGDIEGRSAVLFRENDGALPLIDRLLRTGVDFTLLSKNVAFFTNRQVQDIVAFLKLGLDERDEKSFMRVYSKCTCYIKKNDAEWACRRARRGGGSLLDALIDQCGEYRSRRDSRRDSENAERFADVVRDSAGARPGEAIARIRSGGYDEYLEDKGISPGKVDILQSLAEREESIGGFLGRLRFLYGFIQDCEPAGGNCRLTLSTVHSSKGLEFDNVILMDAFDGGFPTSQRSSFGASKDSADVYQEERRLFYVAITRAIDRLAMLRVADRKTTFIDEACPTA